VTLTKSKGRITEPDFFQFLRGGSIGKNNLQAEKENRGEVAG
jgi:hypothetical protein